MRPKWDERHYGDGRTYGQGTIDTALAGRAEFYAPRPPLRVVPGGRGGSPPPGETEPSDPTGVPEAPYRLTDYGNAERFVAQHGRDVRYCYAWKKWLAWDGRRWRVDDGDRVRRLAKETVRTVYTEASDTDDLVARREIAKHAVKSEAAARIEALLAMAESEPGIPVMPDELDTDPWLLACANGTLDLRSGQLRPHDRADLITKLVPVAYEPAAAAPTWDAFLRRIMDGNADLIAFLQRAIGYSLTGDASERALFVGHGVGKNGKTTLYETVECLLGDYALHTPVDTLMVKPEGGIPNDVARLKGARFVSASEAEEGKHLAESLVKQLTGNDRISARFLHGEFFDFRPVCKLWLMTNHKPVIRGTDEAIWDRIKLIPFVVRIPAAEQDKRLRDKLQAELPGILRWAVDGCLAWQRDGLEPPPAVASATGAYRAEMDVLGGFLADCCVVHPGARAAAKDLYAAYVKWCDEAGERTISQKATGQRLAERGFSSARVGHAAVRTWTGLGLSVDLHLEGFEPADASTAPTHADTVLEVFESVFLSREEPGKARQHTAADRDASANGDEVEL